MQAMAVGATVTLLAVMFILFTETQPDRPVTRFSFSAERVARPDSSPDGKYLLYSAETGGESSLWVRSLSDEFAREVPGTTGAIEGFWSPSRMRTANRCAAA
jgi:hypothetical protein